MHMKKSFLVLAFSQFSLRQAGGCCHGKILQRIPILKKKFPECTPLQNEMQFDWGQWVKFLLIYAVRGL